jgi:hypothetical protein
MIERRRVHANANVVRCLDRGDRDVITDAQAIETAVLVDGQRSHPFPRRLYCATSRPLTCRMGAMLDRTAIFVRARAPRQAPLIPVTGFAE